MKDLRSHATNILREMAGLLPTDSKLRTRFSNFWTKVLDRTGRFVSVTINGHPWKLRNQFRKFSSVYEPEAFRLWTRMIQLGDTVWDVGANIGIYTLTAAQRTGITGSVISWEPTPTTFSILQDHVRENACGLNCRLVNEAISNMDGELTIHIQPDSSSNRIGGKSSSIGSVSVPVHTLDYWAQQENKKPQVIKIDIEGAEVLAFKGMDYLLSNIRPRMLVAIHPQFMCDYGIGADSIVGKLNQHQYLSFTPQGDKADPIKYSEYLLIPKEQARSVQSLFI